MKRVLQEELMDGDSLKVNELFDAHKGLNRIHFWCRTCHVLWNTLSEFITLEREVTIMDVACGNGLISEEICERIVRMGGRVRRFLVDKNDISLDGAKQQSQNALFPTEILQRNLTASTIDLPNVDFVLCSYFFHHLKTEESLSLLNSLYHVTRQKLLIIDLSRTRTNLLLAQIGPKLITKSSIVHHDSIMSVRAAYTIDEFEELITESLWKSYALRKCSFQRFIFLGSKNSKTTENDIMTNVISA